MPLDPFQSSHSRWLALTHRAPSSHSSFFYGVKSTKIYCRPTCTARLARRANVVFYDTVDQARSDSFRPCKRCRPDDATFVGEREEVVIKVIALLRTNKDDPGKKGGLKSLAEEVKVTQSYLCRVFKQIMGMTIGAYMREFETEASEGETESSVQSPRIDVRTNFLTPATTVGSPPAPVESWKVELADEHVERIEDAPPIPLDLDLDLDFDFDEWFWSEDFTKDVVRG